MQAISSAVVLVVEGQADGPVWRGTGTIVGKNLILTAHHVVHDPYGNAIPRLGVFVQGAAEPIAAFLKWTGSAELDVAVLEVDLDMSHSIHPLVMLSSEDIALGALWQAQGYPKVRQSAPSDRLETVGGTCQQYLKGQSRLDLDMNVAPEILNGMSGGPVFVGERVVGVVRAVPVGWKGMRLEATPVGAFLDNPEFRKAIGVDKEDVILDERIERICSDVVAILGEWNDVLNALIKRLNLRPAPGQGPREVANALVRQRKALDIVSVFNQVDSDLVKGKQSKNVRDAASNLLLRILPLAVDWQKVVLTALRDFPDRFTQTTNMLELPLRTETVAEIVLAGVDDRLCQFTLPDAGKMPIGAGVVRIPAASRAALIDIDGSRLAECVVQDLAARFMIDYKKYSDLRDAVEAHLLSTTQFAVDDEFLPFYLLFVREDHDDDKLYALARSKLKNELPSLRLVRLTGTDVKQETLVAKLIDTILRRS